MPPEQAVIDDPQAAAPAAAPAATPAPPPPDRGDVVQVEDDDLSAEALEAVVASAPAVTPAPTAAPAAHDDSQGIPKARFNEVNEERKRLKAEVEELKRAQQAPVVTPAPTPAPPPPFNEDEAEAQYAELLMDGKTKEAVALRKEINRHLQSQAEAAADAKYQARQNETSAQVAQRQLDAAADKAVRDFPYLETEEGAAVQEMIVAYRDRLTAKGMPVAEALSKAVADLAPKFKPDAAAPSPAAAPAAPDKRAADALTRGAADSQRQPPAVPAGVGNRATAGTVKPSKLSDDEFDALPAAEKRRLRGDEG